MAYLRQRSTDGTWDAAKLQGGLLKSSDDQAATLLGGNCATKPGGSTKLDYIVRWFLKAASFLNLLAR